jgi:hypothetical protein
MVAMVSVPRGIRNNNPGNIEYGPFTKGLGATGSDGRFAVFRSMTEGVCALARLLIVYYDKKLPDRIDTVREVINRWAPSNENDTSAYVMAVCQLCEVGPDDILNLREYNTLYWMTCAIGEHENGHKAFTDAVSDADLDTGVRLALLWGEQ